MGESFWLCMLFLITEEMVRRHVYYRGKLSPDYCFIDNGKHDPIDLCVLNAMCGYVFISKDYVAIDVHEDAEARDSHGSIEVPEGNAQDPRGHVEVPKKAETRGPHVAINVLEDNTICCMVVMDAFEERERASALEARESSRAEPSKTQGKQGLESEFHGLSDNSKYFSKPFINDNRL